METLTVIEKSELSQLESTIEKHLSAFYEVGFALMQIRDNKYYRETHGTFEQYCKERWGFERNYANKLIRASEVSENLGTMVPKDISERAIRPLTRLPSEQQKEVYQEAVATAPDGKVTAKHIEQTIEDMQQEEEDVEKVRPVVKEDSEALWALKRTWRRATKKDRMAFISWTKEEENGKKPK